MEIPPSSPLATLVRQDDMFGVKIHTPLADEHYDKIAAGMEARGYPFKSGFDARHALTRILGNSDFLGPEHKHWVDSIICALKLRYEIPGKSPTRAQEALEMALGTWGTTCDPDKGGFILQDGKFLDMSLGGPKRCIEHFRSNEFFRPPCGHPEAIEGWKDIGLIRWISEARGISMRIRPTVAQFRTIQTLSEYRPEKSFHVDVYDYLYAHGSRSYPPGITGEKICVDITQFYNRGVMGSMSQAMTFHCDAITELPP